MFSLLDIIVVGGLMFLSGFCLCKLLRRKPKLAFCMFQRSAVIDGKKGISIICKSTNGWSADLFVPTTEEHYLKIKEREEKENGVQQ